MDKKQIYWDYVLRTIEKEIAAYKELYGARYDGSMEAKILGERLAEAQMNLKNQ